MSALFTRRSFYCAVIATSAQVNPPGSSLESKLRDSNSEPGSCSQDHASSGSHQLVVGGSGAARFPKSNIQMKEIGIADLARESTLLILLLSLSSTPKYHNSESKSRKPVYLRCRSPTPPRVGQHADTFGIFRRRNFIYLCARFIAAA